MTAIRTKSFSIRSAKNFIEKVSDLSEDGSSVYLTLGKVMTWEDEQNPPVPKDSVSDEINLWNSMLFAKRVTGNDVILSIKRHDWLANTVYTPYTHTDDLLSNANAVFYVLTSDFNVYKCIENNMNSPSTIEPTYTNPLYTNKTSDGYVWKYMYSVSRAERFRFVTDQWMPVKLISAEDGSNQWDVQQAVTDGAINSVIITDQGQNYTVAPTITISGDGTGASAVCGINSISNVVNSVTITNPGQGYSYASAEISGVGTGALALPILSPFGGHGSNPVEELGGSNVMINMRIKDTENDKIVSGNDYRQIGLVLDPLKIDGENVASNTVITQAMQVYLVGSGSNYVADEFAYQGPSLASATFKGAVISFDSGNNKLTLSNTRGTLAADSIYGANSAAIRFVSSYIDPELTKYSGQVLYIDNIVPITRNSNQTEDIKIVIAF